MKDVTLSPDKQKLIFIFLGVIGYLSFSKQTIGIQPQSILSDILADFGVIKDFSLATTVVAITIIVLVLVFYFFDR